MLKPIEPGCLAVVVGYEPEVGTVVHVIRFIGKMEDWVESDMWEVDRPLYTLYEDDTYGGHWPFRSAKSLLRIDGDSFEHEERENEEQPTREKETLTR